MLLPANRPANVLLVDDDEDVLESYCHLLRLSGYHPRATTSPHEALALLADQWPGVLVSDIYMPAMNGMDLLASVQALDAEIPVIMITGHGISRWRCGRSSRGHSTFWRNRSIRRICWACWSGPADSAVPCWRAAARSRRRWMTS